MKGRFFEDAKNRVISIGALIMALHLIVTLFIGPRIGMADNGDFYREIQNVGIYYTTDNYADRHFGYFNRFYGIREYETDGGTGFVSSLSVVIRAALILDTAVTGDNVFNISFLAGLYAAGFLFVFYTLLKELTRDMSLTMTFITAALLFFILGDVGYLAYFNSFYGDPLSFLGMLLTFACLLRVIRKDKPGLPDLFLFGASVIVFVGAKQQNSPVGILLAAFMVRLALIRKDKAWRIAAVSMAGVVAVSSGLFYFLIKDDIVHINQYHALTRGILENSDDPEGDLAKLGIDPEFALVSGSTYYDSYGLEDAESNLMQEEFYRKYGFTGIIKYYVTHPDRLMEKLDMAARNGFAIRPEVMGNYEKQEGRSYGEKTSYFTLWSSAKTRLFPGSFKFVLVFYLLFYGVLAKRYMKAMKSGNTRQRITLEFLALVGIIGVIQFGVAFVGAGDADLGKHLFLFNLCFDVMFATLVLSALQSLLNRSGIAERLGAFIWKPKSSISGSSSSSH